MKCQGIFLFVLLGATLCLIPTVDFSLQNRSDSYSADETKHGGFLGTIEGITTSYQIVTYEGNITVENGTYLIENMELHLSGKMTARNNASVIVRNAKLVLSPQGYGLDHDVIVLRDGAKFVGENATIAFQHPYRDFVVVTVNDEAFMNVTNSELSGWAYISVFNTSTVHVQDTIMKGKDPINPDSGVGSHDTSTIHILNSTLEQVGSSDDSLCLIQDSSLRWVSARDNSISEIRNSNIKTVTEVSGNSTVDIVDSNMQVVGDVANRHLKIRSSVISYALHVYSDSDVWIFDSYVRWAQAYDNSTIWLINTSTDDIDTFNNGAVMLGVQLPLFGVVAIPHKWIPLSKESSRLSVWLPVVTGFAIILFSLLIIVVAIFVKRKIKKRAAKHSSSAVAN